MIYIDRAVDTNHYDMDESYKFYQAHYPATYWCGIASYSIGHYVFGIPIAGISDVSREETKCKEKITNEDKESIRLYTCYL
jgi:hypothetical protein